MPPEPEFYTPEIEATTDWVGYQDDLVRQTVSYGWEQSDEIRQRLGRADVRPDDIRGVGDLPHVPVLCKDDIVDLHAEEPPFGGMLAVPIERLRRIYMSPGPILDPEGDRPDFWRVAPALWAAGFREGAIVQNTFGYHLTPAGAMFEEGLRALGCIVIPGGVGNTDWQVRLMAGVDATGYVGTPDFLLTLLQHARDREVTLALQRAFVSGGALPPSLRQELQDTHHVDVFEGYGTADAGMLGYECHLKQGWHVGPSVVIEITDPATGQPVAPGTPGEVIVTSPNDVYPLLRFGTGDLSAFMTETCRCGRTSPRLVGFLGRVGEGVKVRGMFVHPRQLAQVLIDDPAVVRYQAVVTQREHRDQLAVRVEPRSGADLDTKRLAEALRAALKVRARVEVVVAGVIEEGADPLVDERSVEQ